MKKILGFLLILLPILAQDGLEDLEKQLEILDKNIASNNNIWIRKYANFEKYNEVLLQIKGLQKELEVVKKQSNTSDNLFKKHQLETHIETLQTQLKLLDTYKDNPFRDLVQKPEIGAMINVSNPIAILGGISFIKQIESQKLGLEKRQASLQNAIDLLEKKYNLLQEIALQKSLRDHETKNKLYQVQTNVLELQSARDILSVTNEIFIKDTQELTNRISLQIKNQIFKLIYIAIAILVSIGIALLFKILIRKYIHDNERSYMASKIINIFNISIIILILLFAYLDNVTYLVAVVGFASAGLAIAMKDLFMSILGWFVIIIGGSVHVGDRIRVSKDGNLYVGDVLDISVLRITLYEDVTLTSVLENKRAGRIVFVPNNYIFTTLLSNYTHGGMKTVWDCVEFFITFDSDIPKACEIANEVASKYSRGYTENTRRQLIKMRNKYSLKNTNVEPKVFSFIESNGMRICVWYQTNALATLGLRSTISMEIIERIIKEPDIMIAYHTTKLIKDGTDGFGNKMAHLHPIEVD